MLLDPLSANDNAFKEKLSEKEYKSSGVDKSSSFRTMQTLAKLHLGGITKRIMKGAPPFYYFHDFSKEETKEILGAFSKEVKSLRMADQRNIRMKDLTMLYSC